MQEAKENRQREKRFVHSLLNLRRRKLFRNMNEYETFCARVKNVDKEVVKEIKLQIRLLHQVQYVHVCVCVRFDV